LKLKIYKSHTKHQNKFRSHHSISDNKNFKIRSYLTIFWQPFLFVFLINIIYLHNHRTKFTNPEQNICTYRTSYMNCQNKYVYVSNKSADVIFACKLFFIYIFNWSYIIITRTKQMNCQNKREHLSEKDPIIARTSLHVIPNKKM
jgi:hypothetical protein